MALGYGLISEKVDNIIELNQKAWLNQKVLHRHGHKIEKKVKNDFERDFFKLMNNLVFEKAIENIRYQRDIKLVTEEIRRNKRRNKLASEPNYHTTKHFAEKALATKMNKINLKRNKPVYLWMPILYLSKIAIYDY